MINSSYGTLKDKDFKQSMSQGKLYRFHIGQIIQALRQDVIALLKKLAKQPSVRWVRNKFHKLHVRTTQKVHHHTTKKLHDQLYQRVSLYARHWEWRYRKHFHAITVSLVVLVVAFSLVASHKRALASSDMPVTGYIAVMNTNEKIYFGGDHGSSVTLDNFTRQMDGHAWSQDIGWVSFGTESNPQGPVTAGADGTLSGKAKALNVGTIDFDDFGSHVVVSDGQFSGYAWSNDLGWLDFSHLEAAGYDPDLNLPVNASDITIYKSDGGASVAENGWNNTNGFFTWEPATDESGGSGILGYCLYLGQDENGDPASNKGLLGSSPLNTSGTCPFAVQDAQVNLATAGYIATAMTTSDEPYYLRIKAIDNAKNIYDGEAAGTHFRYENTPPTNPAFITAPSQFVASKNVTLTWPTSGGDAAQDANSGIKGLQYRIGNSGTWYGDGHSGSQNISDLLVNDGSYTTVDPIDYDQLQEGNNIVAFRTYDEAGNISIANITTVIKLNTSSPSAPQNLSASPPTNTVNSFSFNWLAPASFQGSVSAISYCYTINVAPTSSNCSFTAPGVTSLSAGPYATQPGSNTIYVVARDEAGNINYATAATETFSANTSAPGVPLNVDVADISVKNTSNWKLTVAWEPPTNVGAGVSSYRVLRSTDNSSFTQVATTAGTSYVDTGLSQIAYYYKIQACDSANNCGAASATASQTPTGRFTTPAGLVSSPSVTVKSRSARITWATDRNSDSRIQLGTSSGSYLDAETAKSNQTKNHVIELNNLSPDTQYFYKARWTDEDGNTGSSSELVFKTLPAPTVKDVSTRRINLSSAIVQFTSKDAVRVKVYYGPNESFGGVTTVNTSTSESAYTVELAGLSDGTKYFYKINTIDSDGNEYNSNRIDSFVTPARPRITNVQFQPVTGQPTSTQKITWETNVASTSLIRYKTNGEPQKEVSNSELTRNHSITIEGLLDDSVYSLTAESRDSLGNLATSDAQTFRTELDTRSPEVSRLKVETSIRGVGSDARGQLIVSWRTDEPATSQVTYDKGASGTNYASSTAEDGALTTEHMVIISDLDTSQVFHLQAISRDKSGNSGKSDDRAAIIGQPSDSVIDIILGTLERIFGL